jgi:hypothetical protein
MPIPPVDYQTRSFMLGQGIDSQRRHDVSIFYPDLTNCVSYTYKQMPNGECVRRIVIGDGDDHARISHTKAPHWDKKKRPYPWQQAHYHEGLTEHYLVLAGWMYVVSYDAGGIISGHYVHAKDSEYFGPREQHCILLSSDAEIVVVTTGVPVGNSDKGGNDWWPADDALTKYAAKLKL